MNRCMYCRFDDPEQVQGQVVVKLVYQGTCGAHQGLTPTETEQLWGRACQNVEWLNLAC
ncbi:hypothetical protein [Paenarthrobacter ureafaciens]|uniref:hypothetical protein n=1 Tax=Paenarthrobacter ureafaciens TaxID=37931 RepID=UPI002DB77372|nr:hypothetical protein [Paenarthrobacter ureafaciens]MEC3853153.1 hypothetical protein [Paenarthrobacter ureafaciens]